MDASVISPALSETAAHAAAAAAASAQVDRLGDGAESNGDGESGSIGLYRKLLQAIRHRDGALVGVEIVLETKKVAHDADRV